MPDDPEKGRTGSEAAAASLPSEALEWDQTAEATADPEARARAAEERLAQVLAAYRQVKVETEQYRERQTKVIERRYEQRQERLLLRFIDVLDSFDRALEAAERTQAGPALVEGLILVRTQLLQTLKEEGLERIPALGLAYDPAISEAVETRPVPDADHHHVVVQELLRGYRVNGKIARHSRVVVGEYRPGAASDSLPAADLIGIGEDADTSEMATVAENGKAAAPSTTQLEDILGFSEEQLDEGPSLEEIIGRAETRAGGATSASKEDLAAETDAIMREMFPDDPSYTRR